MGIQKKKHTTLTKKIEKLINQELEEKGMEAGWHILDEVDDLLEKIEDKIDDYEEAILKKRKGF